MDAQKTLNKIMVALGMAEEIRVEFEQRKMAEGDVVFEAESFAKGEAVFVMNEDGEKIPAPEGHYVMEDGNVMMVDDSGVIIGYEEQAEPQEEEEAPAEAPAEEVEASEECPKGVNCQDGEVNLKEPCWEGYEQIGTKMVDGKEVPNCVPVKAEEEEEVEMSVEEEAPSMDQKEPKKVVESTTTQVETYFAEHEKIQVEFTEAKAKWEAERKEFETIKAELSAEIEELKNRLAEEPSAEPLSHSVEGKTESVRLYKHSDKTRSNTKDSVLARLYR